MRREIMTVIDAIRNRRNIKQFASTPVSEEDILNWFEAATLAPNHRMTEPWKILFIGPETRARLAHKANFGDAPVVLAVLSKRAEQAIDRDENLIATSCFVDNFLLAAWEAGVGARWTSKGATDEGRTVLGVSDDYDVVGLFGIGYPAEVPQPKKRTPIAEKVSHLP
jgi:nitroreductase